MTSNQEASPTGSTNHNDESNAGIDWTRNMQQEAEGDANNYRQPSPTQQQQQQPDSRILQAHRPSFAPPFPVPIVGSTPTTTTPLTNHEIYELIQKSQQAASQQMDPQSGSGTPSQPPLTTRGSFKRPKRSSLYISRHNELERQASVIVGTPGFRERYGKSSSLLIIADVAHLISMTSTTKQTSPIGHSKSFARAI